MVKDRLQELLGGSTATVEIELNEGDQQNGAAPGIPSGSEQSRVQILDKANKIRELIDSIPPDVENVVKLQTDILHRPESNDELRRELEEVMAKIKKKAMGINQELKGFEPPKVNEENRDAAQRMHESQHQTLSHRFRQVMRQYHKIQMDYRQKCKNELQRKLVIAGQTVDDQGIEDLLESGKMAEVFSKSIVSETEEAKQRLREVEDRHADIMRLEKSIMELHEMFMDMAMLVTQQGEMINRIETNVDSTKEYVSSGRKELGAAKEYQTKARRKKFICIGIIVTVVLVIVAILAIIIATSS